MGIYIIAKETEYTRRLKELILPHKDSLVRGRSQDGYVKLMPIVFPFIKDMLKEEGGAMMFKDIVSQLTPAFQPHSYTGGVYTNLGRYIRKDGDSYGIQRKDIRKAILDIYGSDSVIIGDSPRDGGLIIYESEKGLVDLIKKHVEVKEIKLVSLKID